MIETEKPNPFQLLELPTDATKEEIVERGQELCELAETDEQRLLYRWAMEKLITHPSTRLEYELFEIPSTEYEDPEWNRFARTHRKNPVNLTALAKETKHPQLSDFDMAALIGLLLDGLLNVPKGDIRAVLENSPFEAGYGPPPLEVRDVIFG